MQSSGNRWQNKVFKGSSCFFFHREFVRLPVCLTLLVDPWGFSGNFAKARVCTAVTETSQSRFEIRGSTCWWAHHLSSSAHLYAHMNTILKWTLLALLSVIQWGGGRSVCDLFLHGNEWAVFLFARHTTFWVLTLHHTIILFLFHFNIIISTLMLNNKHVLPTKGILQIAVLCSLKVPWIVSFPDSVLMMWMTSVLVLAEGKECL